MSISGGRLRLGIFVVVGALVLLNALAPYGGDVARYVALVLQSVIGIGALWCAVVNVRRTSGVSRTWRILVVAALISWLVGEAFWWLSSAGRNGASAPLPAVVAYFGPPILSFFAMVLLVRSGGGLSRRRDEAPHGAFALAVLDGLVAVAAFSILVFLGGLGAMTTAALPGRTTRPSWRLTPCWKWLSWCWR